MITLRHIEIYKKYRGDGDGFVLCATTEEKAILNYTHWGLIDDLVQDLLLIEKGPASAAFIKSTNEKLKISCNNAEMIQALKEIIPSLL